MRYIIDTDVLIDVFRAVEPAYSVVRALVAAGHEVAICVVQIAEFFAGVPPLHRALQGSKSSQAELAPVPVDWEHCDSWREREVVGMAVELVTRWPFVVVGMWVVVGSSSRGGGRLFLS